MMSMKRKFLLSWTVLCALCCCFPQALPADDGDAGDVSDALETVTESKKAGKTGKDSMKASDSSPAKEISEHDQKKAASAERRHEAVVAVRKESRAKREAALMEEWKERDKVYQRSVEIAKKKGETPPPREPAPDFTRPEGKVDPIELRDGFYKGTSSNKTEQLTVVVRVENGKIRQLWTTAPDSGVRPGVISDLEQQVIRKNCSVIPGVQGNEEFSQKFSDAVEKALKGQPLSKKPTVHKTYKKSRQGKKR